MSTLATDPSSIPFGAEEQWSPGIDCTVYLATYPSGTTPTNAAVTLFDLTVSRPVTLGQGPSTAGNVVTQLISKSLVVAGHTYQLTLTFTPSGTTDILEAILQVVVPSNS